MATTFAIFCETDGSLAFYNRDTVPAAGGEYEGKVASEVYTGFDTVFYTTYTDIPWYNNRSNVTSVNFVDIISPVSTAFWFYKFDNILLTTIDLAKLDTSSVTNMRQMFSGCTALTTLNVSNFNTSKVTSMFFMFNNCTALTTLDVSNFDTSNVTDMTHMFSGCSGLTTLDVSNFDTSKVTGMGYMFNDCTGLTTLDVSNFNTSNVTGMEWMFQNCSSLTTLDVSNFNTSKVTRMFFMFSGCSGLTTLDVSNFDTSSVTITSGMFYDCTGLTTLDVSNFDTSKVIDLSNMFRFCTALTTLDVSNFDTSKVTKLRDTFRSCTALTTLDVSNFDTSSVTDTSGMFYNCSSLTTLDLSNFDTSSVTNIFEMFSKCYNLTTIYVSDRWTIAAVTSNSNMFTDCTNLVGGNGTVYNSSYVDKTYAIIDAEGTPGYLTYKRYVPLKYLFIKNKTLFAIADAIREKEGTTEPIPGDELASRIAAIETYVAPTITVNDSGLVTATTGDKSVTYQITSANDSDFVAANVASGVNIFGVIGSAELASSLLDAEEVGF